MTATKPALSTPGNYRVMDIAYSRDQSNIVHRGEQLSLALLLHVKKTKKRATKEVKELRAALDSLVAKGSDNEYYE